MKKLKIKVGTKSVLFGAHCFLIHPWFVLVAWWKLYGFPWDPRLWIAFFVHDLGYWGKPNMDGPEGETHVELGAKIMGVFGQRWADFSRYHSRFYSKKDSVKPSKLCFADKLAMCNEPDWFYLFRIRLSGEIEEYMTLAKSRNLAGEQQNKYESAKLATNSQKDWRHACVSYVERWVDEHKDGKKDNWTPSQKQYQ